MKKYKLGEICRIASARRIFENEYVAAGIPFIRGQEVSDGSLTNPKSKFQCYISKKRFEELKKEYGIPKKGDILITAVGTIGNLCYLDKDIDFYFKDGNLIWFSDFKEDILSEYLYFFMKGDYFKKQLNHTLIGAVQKALTMEKLSKIEIIVPPLPTQQKIATVLSSLDKKIALNCRINARLEQMAKRLYEHYFVQFDFPTADGKPYKTSGGKMVYSSELKREIPEGWGVKRLGDILENNIEVTDAGEHLKGLKYCPIDEIPMKTMSFANGKPYTEANSSLQLYKRKDILIGAMRVYFHRCCIASEPGITRTTTIVLSPKNKNFLSYVYQVCNEDKTFDYAIKVSNGTQQPYVTWKSLKEYQFVYPKDEKIIEDFCKNTNSIIDRILENVQESARLTSLRDRLLPLLMNGQVSV